MPAFCCRLEFRARLRRLDDRGQRSGVVTAGRFGQCVPVCDLAVGLAAACYPPRVRGEAA